MKSKKLLTVVSLLLMVLSSSAVMFAQEPSKVSGRVLDEDGNPLVGAFVSAKGTNAGTVTDVDGNFTLSVPVGSKVLLFSMLGQQEKELPYEVGKTWYQVVLMSDTQMIEETVVVGYGTMIKRELTSSVSSVNGQNSRSVPLRPTFSRVWPERWRVYRLHLPQVAQEETQESVCEVWVQSMHPLLLCMLLTVWLMLILT